MPLVDWLDNLCCLIKTDPDPAEVVQEAFQLVEPSYVQVRQAECCLSYADGEGFICMAARLALTSVLDAYRYVMDIKDWQVMQWGDFVQSH